MTTRLRRGAEDGAGSLEVVLVMAGLIVVITFVVQFALWQQAQHVAVAAAQDGAQAARVEGATASIGQERARSFLAQTASRLVETPTVDASRDAQVARVTVRGQVTSLLPGLRLPVRASAAGPVERFRPETEEFGR